MCRCEGEVTERLDGDTEGSIDKADNLMPLRLGSKPFYPTTAVIF